MLYRFTDLEMMKALDRGVETLGPWIVTSSVTFIKSVNQWIIKPYLNVHLVAVWTFNVFYSNMFPMILTKEEIYPKREKIMTKLLGVENKT